VVTLGERTFCWGEGMVFTWVHLPYATRIDNEKIQRRVALLHGVQYLLRP
jgi:hypothetical protein